MDDADRIVDLARTHHRLFQHQWKPLEQRCICWDTLKVIIREVLVGERPCAPPGSGFWDDRDKPPCATVEPSPRWFTEDRELDEHDAPEEPHGD